MKCLQNQVSPIIGDPVCNTSLGEDTWHELYTELYHSAYDTSALLSPDSIYPRYLRFDKHIVPLFMLDYDYNALTDNALTGNTYFDFNPMDSSISDKKRSASPYYTGRIFAAAPLDVDYPFSNPTFRVDPDLIFTDTYNAFHFNNSENAKLKIDFGDGNGYVTINATAVQEYAVTYPSAGMKTIQTAVFDKRNAIICYSVSKINIKTNYVAPEPTLTFDYPGIEAELYGPCASSATMPGKIVLYLSGFDPLDMALTNEKYSRHANQIYSEMISKDELVQLKNFGYSFLVVDWKNSRTDIRFNALYLVNLLEKLKCDLSIDAQQFVIMGESMGGLVARFAMNYMESQAYLQRDLSPFFMEAHNPTNLAYLEQHPELFTVTNNWKNCFLEKQHNTRLLITMDTPNQGANIPLSLQKLFKGIEGIFKFLPLGQELSLALKANNFALSGMAAKEMLIYHVDYPVGNAYSSAPEKFAFFAQLKAMGNYPQHAKLVGMSNGSLSGINQDNYYTGLVRNPGDLLLGINLDKNITVLGKEIPLFSCQANFKSNPNGYDNIVHANLGFYFHVPLVYFFGISFFSVYIPLLPNYNEFASTLPFCTSAGGYIELSAKHPGEGGFFDNSWVHSDGPLFCFVPIQSALDYGVLGNYPPLGSNIERENITYKLSLTPYDLIVGYPGESMGTNRMHLNYRNPIIQNSAINHPTAPIDSKVYFSCQVEDNTIRSLLGMEIGDEELYLENCSLAWDASFQAEFDIHVNERNRYYEYPSYYHVGFNEQGYYSKERPFVIEATKTANFYYDSQNLATGIGISYSPPTSGNYLLHDAPVAICCKDFYGERISKPSKPQLVSSLERFTFFPNPLNKESSKLQLANLNAALKELIIYDLFGNLIFNHRFTSEEIQSTTIQIDLSGKVLAAGIYILNVTGDNFNHSEKLIVLNQ